jgi:integrase/recombinase XerC
VAEFLVWWDDNGVTSITAVQPLHVSAWLEQQTREHATPTAKLRLAALRHLFDWLVAGQVIPTNPAGSVRGPSHVVKSGKTPVLAPEEARALIDKIEITTPAGLRDRALIGLMVFSFARRRFQGAAVPHHRTRHRIVDVHSPAPGQRLRDDRPARRGGRYRD